MVSRQIRFVRREFKRTTKEQLASQTIYEDGLDPFEEPSDSFPYYNHEFPISGAAL